MSSRSIALAGRIAPPAQTEKPSRRVFGFDPAMDVVEGPWWKQPMPFGEAVVDNTDGHLVSYSAGPFVPPEHVLCGCGHKGKAHRNYWSTALGRGVWACTITDANATCACQDFHAAVEPHGPPKEQEAFLPLSHAKAHIEGTSPQSRCACGHKRHAHQQGGSHGDRLGCTLCGCAGYEHEAQAKLATLAVKLSTSMASIGAAAAASAGQFTAAMQQVEATMAAIDQQAFVDGKPGNAERHGRIKELIKLARDISSTSGQSFTEVIAGMRAMGAFD